MQDPTSVVSRTALCAFIVLAPICCGLASAQDAGQSPSPPKQGQTSAPERPGLPSAPLAGDLQTVGAIRTVSAFRRGVWRA